MREFMRILVALAISACMACALPCQSLADDASGEESSQVADSSEYGGRSDLDTGGSVEVYAEDLPEGTYPMTVDTDSSMFNVTACELTVAGSQMSAVLTLSGDGYERLFMGTGEQAVSADPSEYSEAVVTEGGEYTYTVDVPVLNVEVDCCAFSEKNQKWYDHKIVFEASSLPSDVIKAYDYSAMSESPFDGAGRTSLDDGTYTMDVEMSGGSGKVSLLTPATVVVKDNKAYARIEWSSPNYDYMVVKGYIFTAVSNDETSVFEIPILRYDEGMEVIADTLAMSEPHEIEYTLTFSEGSATPAASVSSSSSWVVPVVAGVAAAAVVAVVIVLVRKKRRN